MLIGNALATSFQVRLGSSIWTASSESDAARQACGKATAPRPAAWEMLTGKLCDIKPESYRKAMMRDVKLGRGHQRSTGLGHRGSRHRRYANIRCSKYYFRSLRILSLTGFPDSILTVLVTCHGLPVCATA
jgi:hypothetical protein